MKVVATIEARMSATRLPGKVLKDLCGAPMLARMVERVRGARCVDEVVVATTVNPADDAIARWAESECVPVFRGSEDDVLDRVLQTAKSHEAGLIAELGGDAPLVDPDLIDDMVAFFLGGEFDYVANTSMRHSAAWGKESTFPVGTSVEIFTTSLLTRVAEWTRDPIDHEHVTSFIFDRPDRFRLGAFEAEGRWSACRRPEIRLTVDTPEDFELVSGIFERLFPANPRFSLADVIQLLESEPELLKINGQVRQKRAFEQRREQSNV